MPLRMRIWMIILCALLAACQSGLQPPTPDTFAADLERAKQYIEKQNFPAAAALLETLTQTFPEDPTPWRLLAGLQDLDKHPEKAHATFTQGLAEAPATSSGYADLALQSALLCIRQPQLACSSQRSLQTLADSDPRRELVAAAEEVQAKNDLKALRRLITLLKQQLPKGMISDVYFLAAQIYTRMGEPMYVNESLFHAVNFAQSPVLILRIEKLWKPKP